MGNVVKAVATGGLSLLPGKAGKVASAIGTGGASLLPGKVGRIAGGIMGDPTAIFGGGQYRKGPQENPLGGPPVGGPPAGIAEKGMPGYGPMREGVASGPPPGLISKLVGATGGGLENPAEAAQVETPRQRAARQAEQKAGRNKQRALPVGRVNPAEASRPILNKIGMF